jgi:hypothetical protein
MRVLKNKKIRLTENDVHVIDAYSKKNLSDTMPQFGNLEENLEVPVQGMTDLQNQN